MHVILSLLYRLANFDHDTSELRDHLEFFKMRYFGLFLAALAQNNDTDSDIIVLEEVQQYIDESLMGAR